MTAAFSEFVDPHPAAGNQFGQTVVALSSGNVVITSPFDDAQGTDLGAVYLFNGATGALISTLTGLSPGDQLGDGGVSALSNGNFVVASPHFDYGAIDAGAVTFGNGLTGINGFVDSGNSLVGGSDYDLIGGPHLSNYSCVNALQNGNYVVTSQMWDNTYLQNAGAVAFCSGVSGLSGAVNAVNSLLGSTGYDQVGELVLNSGQDYDFGHSVIPLSNGDYIVSSSAWNNGLLSDAGAATFGSGTSGVTGAVSSFNSVLGGTANTEMQYAVADEVNGNYFGRFVAEGNGKVRVMSLELSPPNLNFVVTNTADSGPGSLRAAITNSNLHVGADTITFDIPGSGVQSIAPLSSYPTITDPVTIDATTQPGFAGTPIVELNFLNAAGDGLHVTGGNTTVRGFVINFFSGGAGIHFEGIGANTVEGNYIGTDRTGMLTVGDSGGQAGVSLENGAGDSQIGGTSPGAGNLISVGGGGGGSGVLSHGSSGNTVVGNRIGANLSGTFPNNGSIGIQIDGGSDVNLIGGQSPAEGNSLIGNVVGVRIGGGLLTDFGNVIQNNTFTENDVGVKIGNGQSPAIGNAILENLITGCTQAAIEVFPFSYDNQISLNSIFGNAGLGIDLNVDGVTQNDPGDSDDGANNLQNFPVLTSVTTGASTHIQGGLQSTPNSTFRLEFFANSSANPSGSYAGERFIGTSDVTTDAGGNAVDHQSDRGQ